jgi:hypothetical protein
MANSSTKTTEGKKVYLYRANTATASMSATQYLNSDRYRLGVGNATSTVNTTALTSSIPIDNGTVLSAGTQTMTGSAGGDNSTDNTTTYKVGAGLTDAKSQNLIANGTSASKTWTVAALSTNATATSFIGHWLYIKDATALAKFKTSGTCVEMRVGSDTSNYYSLTWTAASLAVGWNWLSSAEAALNSYTMTGTVSGNIDTLVYIITTNNSTDTFVAGDVLFDLLRQWTITEAKLAYVSGFPSLNMTNLEATTRMLVSSTQAVGYDINGLVLQNRDTSPLTTDAHTFTAESKSSTDEFVFIAVDRIL